MTLLIAKLLCSYLLGSVMGGLVVGRLRGGVDIRELGSGNAGGTNALRTQGKAFAFWVMVIDVGKALVAVLLVAPASVAALGPDLLAADATAYACGAAAVVGHVWPVLFGFRGGKGAATLLGTLAATHAFGLVPVLVVFATSLVLSGFVGISTVLATWSLAVYAALATERGIADPLFAFAVAMALFITWTHRANLQRMRAGNENRFEKVMLFRRRAGG
jgi:glycerol-3-phosphate acyltransferase PlsY